MATGKVPLLGENGRLPDRYAPESVGIDAGRAVEAARRAEAIPATSAAIVASVLADTESDAAKVMVARVEKVVGGLSYGPGLYYTTPSGGRAGVSRPNGFSTLMPMRIDSAHVFSGLAIEVVTPGNAGSTARLGVYRDANGRPGALVIDAGIVSTATTGIKAITGLAVSLLPGWYHLAVCVQVAATTAPNIRGFGPGQVIPGSPLAYAQNGTLQHGAGWAIGNGGQGALAANGAAAEPADTCFAAVLIG